MSSTALLNELRLAQDLVTGLVESLDDNSHRQQYHEELSPLGWHLGHCAYTECYWLQEVVLGDSSYTDPVKTLYTPALTPKPERGDRLPPLAALVQWTLTMQAMNLDTLIASPATLTEHRLMQDDYLLHFLIQHYNQHYETMLSALTQRALLEDTHSFRVLTPFRAVQPVPETVPVQPGDYKVGGRAPAAYDNELPAQQATLGPYRIARKPVSNGEFLAFMEAGGYNSAALWSTAGWRWRSQLVVACPDHWRQDEAGHWYGTGIRGAYELDGTDNLLGISQHEASAYANWAGGRLPHEHQWEVACRLQHLELTGRAWEWCLNTFYPYEGFRAFPYAGYSTPYYDHRHYTLRGGSLHTRPAIKRPSFRNFHEPGKRHIFAGLRLVFDESNE
jgi:iron(II)-dependent oxidoreductase